MKVAGPIIATIGFLSPLLVLWPVQPPVAVVSQVPGGGFLENKGQFPPSVLFKADIPAGVMWITQDSLWYSLVSGVNIRLEFVGASSRSSVEPSNQLPGKTSYYRGGDPDGWLGNIPSWGSVKFRDIYPGIDLEYQNIGASPLARLIQRETRNTASDPRIQIRLSGASLRPDMRPITRVEAGSGHLILALPVETALGETEIPLPVSDRPWSLEAVDTSGQVVEIPIHPGSSSGGLPASQGPLETFPGLVYGSYLGGSLWDQADAVGFDNQGKIYLAGYTLSLDFPTKAGFRPLNHNPDVIAASLDTASNTPGYLAIFRGGDLLNGEEYATDLAVDPTGNAYLIGRTNSADFPTTPGAYSTTHLGAFDAFILKLDPDGNLVYSTFLGGTDTDLGASIALQGDGSVVVSGGTFSTDFPTTPDALYTANAGLRDLFISKINPEGSGLDYSTFYGGGNQDQTEEIDLGSDGSLYLTGWTNSDDFPTSPDAFDSELNAGFSTFDAFLLRLTLDDQPAIFSTYLGGGGEDRGYGIRATPGGGAIAAGRTNSVDFPITPSAAQASLGGGLCPPDPCPDAYFAVLSPDGKSLGYASFLGGADWDQALDLAAGSDGAAYLTGETYSADFPVSTNAGAPALSGERDSFVVRFSENNQELTYASFLGGGDWDEGTAVAVDANEQVYLAGRTRSNDFPTTPDAYAPFNTGDYDAYGLVLELPHVYSAFLPLLAAELQLP